MESIESVKRFELLRELRNLRRMRGNGTELISLYIPEGYSIAEVTNKLRDEYGQAGNIKSKTTRLNVQGAIEKIIQYLKLYKTPPKNGFAIFCGNLSDKPGVPDIKLFSVEPPLPIKVQIYRCDSQFFLEPLENMLEIKEVYMLLVIDGREATIGLLKGKQVEVKRRITSFAPSKTHKGGSSSARYQRIVAERIEDFYKRVADAVNEIYLQSPKEIKGIIVGGPGPVKENFLKMNALNYQLKVLGVYDISYTDETGFNELLNKAMDLLKNQETTKERELMQKFLKEVSSKGKGVYGINEVIKALDDGRVETLLISEEFNLFEVKYKCKKCGAQVVEYSNGSEETKKHDCGGELQVVEKSDAMDILIDKALKIGADIEFISTETQEGKELAMGFGKVGAILRY